MDTDRVEIDIRAGHKAPHVQVDATEQSISHWLRSVGVDSDQVPNDARRELHGGSLSVEMFALNDHGDRYIRAATGEVAREWRTVRVGDAVPTPVAEWISAGRLPQIAEALVVRPGDTLIVRVDPDGAMDEIVRVRDQIAERLSGVTPLVIGGAEQIAVYRPGDDPCST